MAKKMMFISDKSGASIPDTEVAKVKITYADGRRPVREADVTPQEADELAALVNARSVARRGRRPQS